jgi:hypothetical protein
MAHTPEKRAIVRAAYIHEQLPIEMAAEKAGVAERTAQRWKADALAEGEDWDKTRAVKHLAGQGFDNVLQSILADYLTVHQAVMKLIMEKQGEMNPLALADALASMADAFTKTMAGIGKASPKHMRLAVANEVLRLFGDFVRERHPKAAPVFIEVLPPFAEALARHFE